MELIFILRHSETGEILAETTIENPRRIMFRNEKWRKLFDKAEFRNCFINKKLRDL